MRASVRKLKTLKISKQGKRLLLLATTWKIMEELRREACIRGHHIQTNMESSYWRGAGAMQEGALKCGGSIFCCHQERRSCCWTFATKDIQTVFTLFATRRYHWLHHNWSEKILCILCIFSLQLWRSQWYLLIVKRVNTVWTQSGYLKIFWLESFLPKNFSTWKFLAAGSKELQCGLEVPCSLLL